MEAFFNLNGSTLAVEAEDAALLDTLLAYFGELSTPISTSADFKLVLERGGERTAPLGAEVLYEGPMPEGQFSRLVQAGDIRWFNVPGALSFEFSLPNRWGRLSVRSGSEAILMGTPAIVVVNMVLTALGQFLLHAAGLVLPKSERAIALFAPSGVGKTTTTLALTLAGFGFLTDDAIVVMPPERDDAAGFRIWGLPRSLKVHHRTCELLPAIAPLLGSDWNNEGEQVLTRVTLKTVAEVCPPRPFSLTAVVLLGQRVEGASVFREISKAELLLSLADDNVRRGRQGVMADEIARFQALSAAVAATPAYELWVGSDLGSLGPLLKSLFNNRQLLENSAAMRTGDYPKRLST
jgi:hypothetical protein